MGQATQEDVARLAGVSRATVSYVLNNQSGGKVRISDETRQRVQEAIRQLGYQPDAAARALRTGRAQLLAVMVPDLTNPFYPLLIRGAQRQAEAGGYELLVYDTADRADRERTFVDTMLRRRVDGVMLVAFHLEESDVARLRAANIQVAAVGGRLRTSAVDLIATPERAAVAEEIAHLVARGHRRIAHLAGPQETPPGRARFRGYRSGLENAAIPFDEALVRFGGFGREGVEAMIESLFAGDALAPTAIFAANDVVAIAALRALARRGLHVPNDVAVCGFDNIPEAEVVSPALTTVAHDAQAHGERAAALLLERLASDVPFEPRRILMPFQLIVRESTGGAAHAPASNEEGEVYPADTGSFHH